MNKKEIKQMILEKLMDEMGDADISRFKPKKDAMSVEMASCEVCDDEGCEECDTDSMDTTAMKGLESEDEYESLDEEDDSMSDFMKAVMAAKKKTMSKS